jgi:hypothetical protein
MKIIMVESTTSKWEQKRKKRKRDRKTYPFTQHCVYLFIFIFFVYRFFFLPPLSGCVILYSFYHIIQSAGTLLLFLIFSRLGRGWGFYGLNLHLSVCPSARKVYDAKLLPSRQQWSTPATINDDDNGKTTAVWFLTYIIDFAVVLYCCFWEEKHKMNLRDFHQRFPNNKW